MQGMTSRGAERLRALVAVGVLAGAGVFWGCGGQAQNSQGNQASESEQPAAGAVEGRASAESGSRAAAGEAEAGLPASAEATRQSAGSSPARGEASSGEGSAARGASSGDAREALPALTPVAKRVALPPLDMRDMNGRSVTTEDLRGEVVLLNFWATWCGPCRMEIPLLVQLHDRYGDQGLRIIAPSIDRTGLGAVKPFMDKHPEIHYTIVPNGNPAAMAMGGVGSIPTTFLVDRRGRVISRFVGLMRPEALEGYVKAALRETS